MSGTAHPTIAMRPMLPADVPLLAEVFRESIEELAADDYSESQREARHCLGAYARVVEPGAVRVGDPVELL